MENLFIRNAIQFPLTKLKVVFGKIPESICGSYIRNGSNTVKLGENILSHWYYGNGGLLKVQIKNGQCWAKFKYLETPKYKIEMKTKKFNLYSILSSMVKGIFNKNIMNQQNAANTSVLRLKGNKNLYALYEGGLPFKVSQRTIQSQKFDDLGFIKTAFSAHPKIDPINQDIYNVGFEMNKLKLYRLSKELKLIAQNEVQLRAMQSIHDCCLAGDFLVVLQCPATYDKMKLLKGYTVAQSIYYDYNYGKTHIWIFNKQDLKLIKKIDYAGTPFFTYHFTNGYSDKSKIVLQYPRYSGQNAQKIFDTVQNVPQIAVNKFKPNGVFSQLQNLQISLQDFSIKSKIYEFNCEFPVCEQQLTGKEWKDSYFIGKQKGEDFLNFNTLIKFDRLSQKGTCKTFKDCVIGQPALIRTKQGLFVIAAVTKSQTKKSYVWIMKGENFQLVAELQLPEVVPFGYHGKWQNIEDNSLFQSSEIK